MGRMKKVGCWRALAPSHIEKLMKSIEQWRLEVKRAIHNQQSSTINNHQQPSIINFIDWIDWFVEWWCWFVEWFCWFVNERSEPRSNSRQRKRPTIKLNNSALALIDWFDLFSLLGWLAAPINSFFQSTIIKFNQKVDWNWFIVEERKIVDWIDIIPVNEWSQTTHQPSNKIVLFDWVDWVYWRNEQRWRWPAVN